MPELTIEVLERGGPAFVVGPFGCVGDGLDEAGAKRVPGQLGTFHDGERECERACLPRRVEDELAVVPRRTRTARP